LPSYIACSILTTFLSGAPSKRSTEGTESPTAIGAILMVVDENERKIFLEIEFEGVETPKREASIMAAGGFM